MKRTGKIYTYTIVYSTSEDFKDKTPYALAMVEENGCRSVGILDGYDGKKPVKIGMEVDFSREDKEGCPIYKLA